MPATSGGTSPASRVATADPTTPNGSSPRYSGRTLSTKGVTKKRLRALSPSAEGLASTTSTAARAQRSPEKRCSALTPPASPSSGRRGSSKVEEAARLFRQSTPHTGAKHTSGNPEERRYSEVRSLRNPYGVSYTPVRYKQYTSVSSSLTAQGVSPGNPRGIYSIALGIPKNRLVNGDRCGPQQDAEEGTVGGMGSSTSKKASPERSSEHASAKGLRTRCFDASPATDHETAQNTTPTTAPPMMHGSVPLMTSTLSAVHSRTVNNSSAALHAFQLGLQNCLSRQGRLLERLDLKLAQVDASGHDKDEAMRMLSSWLPSSLPSHVLDAKLPPSAQSLHQRPRARDGQASALQPADPISPWASCTVSPGQRNRMDAPPGAAAAAQEGRVYQIDTASIRQENGYRLDAPLFPVMSTTSPLLSEPSSAQESFFSESRHHSRQLPQRLPSDISSGSVSVVLMRPALERTSGHGSHNMVQSLYEPSQHIRASCPPMSSSALLPAGVQQQDATDVLTQIACSAPIPLLTTFSSDTITTPPSPANLDETQRQLSPSNKDNMNSSRGTAAVTSPASDRAPSTSYSPFIPFTTVIPSQRYASQRTSPDVEMRTDGIASLHRSVTPLGEPEGLDPGMLGWMDGKAATPVRDAGSAVSANGDELVDLSSTSVHWGLVKGEAAAPHQLVQQLATGDSGTTATAETNGRMSGDGSDVVSMTGGSVGVEGDGEVTIGDVSPQLSSLSPFQIPRISPPLGSLAAPGAISLLTSRSADSVSLSPLSRPLSIWGGSPLIRSILSPATPGQQPTFLQHHPSVTASTISTTWMSPRHVASNNNSRSSNNARGQASVATNRSPRAGSAAPLGLSHTATASVSSANSLPSTDRLASSLRNRSGNLSPPSAAWSPFSPTLSRRASGGALRNGATVDLRRSSSSGLQLTSGSNESSSRNAALATKSSTVIEGTVTSSLSSASLRAPASLLVRADGASTAAAVAADANVSPIGACRQLMLSPSPSMERLGDHVDAGSVASLRSRGDSSGDVDHHRNEDPLQRRIGHHAGIPAPSTSSEEVQPLLRRRQSAPPVSTMRRPPMAPPRPLDAAVRSGATEYRRDSTPAPTQPEKWLSFERQHEQQHLPPCWRDSEVIVVDPAEEASRDRQAEVMERLRLLEEEFLQVSLQHPSELEDCVSPSRRGRRRGSLRDVAADLTVVADVQQEGDLGVALDEELDWGDDSEEDSGLETAAEWRFPQLSKSVLWSRRNVRCTSRRRGGGSNDGRFGSGSSPPSSGSRRHTRDAVGKSSALLTPASSSDGDHFLLFEQPLTAGATVPFRVRDAYDDSSTWTRRSFHRRHSAPAAFAEGDSTAEWMDRKARFAELLSIQHCGQDATRENGGSADGPPLPERKSAWGAVPGTASRLPGRGRSRSVGEEGVFAADVERVPSLLISPSPKPTEVCEAQPDQSPSHGVGKYPSLKASSVVRLLERTNTYPFLRGSRPSGEGQEDIESHTAGHHVPPTPPLSSSPAGEGPTEFARGSSSLTDLEGSNGVHSRSSLVEVTPKHLPFFASSRYPTMVRAADYIGSSALDNSCGDPEKLRGNGRDREQDMGDRVEQDRDLGKANASTAITMCTPAVLKALRTPKRRVRRISRVTAAAYGVVRPRRIVTLHRAPSKLHLRASGTGGGGEAATREVPLTDPAGKRACSAQVTSTADTLAAVTDNDGRPIRRAFPRKERSRMAARRPKRRWFQSRCGPRHSSHPPLDDPILPTFAAAVVKTADGGTPAATFHNHGSTRAHTAAATLPNTPEHAHNGVDSTEPLSSRAIVVVGVGISARRPSAASLPAPPVIIRSGRDGSIRPMRQPDEKRGHTDRGSREHAVPEHQPQQPRRALSSLQHRAAGAIMGEAEAAAPLRTLSKTGTRPTPAQVDVDVRPVDNGGTENVEPRALWRRLAEHKDRTRIMEESILLGSALGTSTGGSYSGRNIQGVATPSSAALPGVSVSDSTNHAAQRNFTRASTELDPMRQLPENGRSLLSARGVLRVVTPESPALRAGAAKAGEGLRAEVASEFGTHAAEAMMTPKGTYGVSAAPLSTPPPSSARRRRVDLHTRVSSKITAPSFLSANSTKRHPGLVVVPSSVTNATPPSARLSYHVESGLAPQRSRSPRILGVSHKYHHQRTTTSMNGGGDVDDSGSCFLAHSRRRHTIGEDSSMMPSTVSVRGPFASLASLTSELAD